MAGFSSGAGKGLWRADKWVAVAALLAIAILHLATDAISTLERRFYDFASTQNSRTPSDRIAVIAIDDASIATIGRWPWPREVHANLIDRLSAAGAKTIVHTTFFFEPQTDRGLDYIRRLKERLPPGAMASVGALLREAEDTLDADAKLAESIRRAGNVLLPAVLTLGPSPGRPDHALPLWVSRDAFPAAPGYGIPAHRIQYPIERIGSAAAAIGHLNQIADVDGAAREVPLLVEYDGQAVPSMALLAAARELNLQPGDIRLRPGQEIRLGGLRVRTDEQARLLPQFYARGDRVRAFAPDSFQDVLSGRVDARRYQGRIVLIGATAAGVGTTFAVPGQPGLAPVEMLAHLTSSILQEHSVFQPYWADLAAAAATLLISLYLLALLPRLSAAGAATATALGLALLLGAEFALLSHALIWIKLVFPATLLFAGHLALTTRGFLVTEAGKLRADDESAEANRMMGLALQGQGQLDMAFDRFRRVPLGEAVMDNLYRLALDFERRRQYNKAEAIYRHMSTWDPEYRDLRSRLGRAQSLSETVILGGASGPGSTLMLADDDTVEKPMLGRYLLEKELGKGAMGVVYLGRDPRIGRTVAIKTVALRQEFDGAELDEARRRFFREAETAGRLAHPNIVTVFDAGEEHDLAYIAMELLQGHDLTEHCQPDCLLPVTSVMTIVARVAEALAYAHAQGVVHRDIKPANILHDPASDVVKVTDFGIARVADASRTRTGTILGTPSFMSPEQIAGRAVDGRSDLYSLGVTLFQLLTGALPFQADSLAALMYKIANEEAPDLRTLRPELPEALARLVARALAKRPELRLADGLAFAAGLRACEALLQHDGASKTPLGAAPDAGYHAPRFAHDPVRVAASLAPGAQSQGPDPGVPTGVPCGVRGLGRLDA